MLSHYAKLLQDGQHPTEQKQGQKGMYTQRQRSNVQKDANARSVRMYAISLMRLGNHKK